MVFNIPPGWYYAGSGHTHTTLYGAEKDLVTLKNAFRDQKFDILFDDRGGKGYERYIIITDVDQLYGKYIKRKIKKNKTKTKRRQK